MVQPGVGRAPADESAATLNLGPELQNATALTHAQVAQLLEPKREMLQDMDATQQALLLRTLNYVAQMNPYKNEASAKAAREALERHPVLRSFEVAQLCNLNPETIEEAMEVIPSLRRINEVELQVILDELAVFRRYQS